tara:strand:+ start:111 stop:728 length:618 start_codon:yes stop_codon:yes gene_type:complete
MKDLVNTTGKMTSLAIAEITGKQHKDVMRSIRKMEDAWTKLGQRNFALSSYINEQNRAMPMYELTKTETLYIATKFNDEARAKLVLRWQELETKQSSLSPAEQLLQNAQLLVAQEQKLIEHDSRLKKLEAKATTTPEYYTIAGYSTLNGISVNIKMASKLGREASRICKNNGYMMDEIPDPRFGKVKMYPRSVLNQVFNSLKLVG